MQVMRIGQNTITVDNFLINENILIYFCDLLFGSNKGIV